MFSLAAIRYADAAARLKSFSAAARECDVSQPTVSAAIADLEVKLGATLFLRGRRTLELTSTDTRLLPRIAEILGDLHALQAEISRSRLNFTIRTEDRFHSPYRRSTRADSSRPFNKHHLETRMFFYELSVVDLERRLSAGQLDVIIGCDFRRVRTHQRLKLLSDTLLL